RVLPAGLGAAGGDPEADVDATKGGYHWLEPRPGALTPATAFTAKGSIRPAGGTGPGERPGRPRPGRGPGGDGQFSAAEVAELLETTPAAVNSALQRARTHLAEVAATDDDVAEPEDQERIALVERYCAAFENGDVAALTELLTADVKLEMPPFAMWFTGRDAVTRFLASRAFDN